jgi:hypothetical protein
MKYFTTDDGDKNWFGRGFSLLTVLVAVMAGLVISGGTFQLIGRSSGAGGATFARDAKYNILSGGTETGKAALRKLMDNDKEPPRHFTGDREGTSMISKAGDLLVRVVDSSIPIDNGVVVCETLDKARLGKLGIAGESAELKVMIYDMQYSPARAPAPGSGISEAALRLIPPSTIVSAFPSGLSSVMQSPEPDETGAPGGGAPNRAGAYLIRAALTIDGNTTILDAAVIQANNL